MNDERWYKHGQTALESAEIETKIVFLHLVDPVGAEVDAKFGHTARVKVLHQAHGPKVVLGRRPLLWGSCKVAWVSAE